MEKLEYIAVSAIHYLLLVAIAAMPSLYAAGCFHHYTGPKDFMLLAGGAAVGVLLSIAILARYGRVKNERFRFPAPALLFLCCGVFAAASMANSNIPGLSGARSLFSFMLLVWFAGAFVSCDTPERRERLLLAAILSGIVPAVALLLEFTGIRFLDVWNNVEQSGLSRRETVISTFGNPAYAAPFFGTLAVINIRNLMYSEKILKMAFFGSVQALFLAACFAPMARSSIIALVISLAAYRYFAGKSSPNRTAAFTNALVIALVAASAIQLFDMISGREETLVSRAFGNFFAGQTVTERVFMLKVGARLAAANPFLGAGAGTMLLSFPLAAMGVDQSGEYFRAVPYDFNPQHIHNEFVNMAAETGIPSLVAFAGLLALALYGGASSAIKKNDKNGLCAAATAGVLFIVIDSMFNVTFTLAHMNLLFAVLLALLVAEAEFARRWIVTVDVSGRVARVALVWCLVMISLFSAIYGYKYILSDRELMKGHLEHLSHRGADALALYARSFALNPYLAEPLYFSSRILRANGEIERAVECLKAASNLNLSFPIVSDLAELAVQHLDMNSELRYLNALSKAYPRYVKGHLLLGHRFLREKKSNPAAVDMAVSAFCDALAVEPKNTSAMMSLAEIYFDRGMHGAASAEIDAALAVEPGLANAVYLKKQLKGFFF